MAKDWVPRMSTVHDLVVAPVLPHRHVFLDGDFSVVGVTPVHVGDVLDGIRAGRDAFVVGVGCGLGHGRERGSGARVEGV